MDLFLIVNIQYDKRSETFDEHDFGVLSIGHNFCRSEVVNLEGFECTRSNWKVRSAGTELSTFCQRINIDGLGLSPNDVKELVWSWNAGYLSIVAALVGDLCDDLLSKKIINVDDFVFSFKYNSIIVIPSFLIVEDSRSKSFDVRSVIVSPLKLTFHSGFCPVMSAGHNMGLILAVLVVVHDNFLANFRHHIGMEKHDISWRQRMLHYDTCLIDLVKPVSWNTIAFWVLKLILNVWTQSICPQRDFQRLRIVDWIKSSSFKTWRKYCCVQFVN